MSDLIKKIKIKKQDGTFTDYIPIGAEAQNISTSDGDSVQLKLNKKPYYYNTVADMKADLKLKVGDMAITLGYYSINDGGAAEYKIVNSSDKHYETLNNNLKAELIIFERVNVLQAGAKKDNTGDNAPIFNSLINKYKSIYIPAGQYIIDGAVHIDNGNNIDIVGDYYKTEIISGPSITVGHGGFSVNNINGLKIENLVFTGSTTLGDGMDGIHILDVWISKNIKISNCIFHNNNYAASRFFNCDNVQVIGCKFFAVDCGVITMKDYAKNIFIKDCYFDGLSDNLSQETYHNYNSEPISIFSNNNKDIIISDCSMKNKVGSAILLGRNDDSIVENVTVNNILVENCSTGITLRHCVNAAVSNLVYTAEASWDSKYQGLVVNNTNKSVFNNISISGFKGTAGIYEANGSFENIYSNLYISLLNPNSDQTKFIYSNANYNQYNNITLESLDDTYARSFQIDGSYNKITISKIKKSANETIRVWVGANATNNNIILEDSKCNYWLAGGVSTTTTGTNIIKRDDIMNLGHSFNTILQYAYSKNAYITVTNNSNNFFSNPENIDLLYSGCEWNLIIEFTISGTFTPVNTGNIVWSDLTSLNYQKGNILILHLLQKDNKWYETGRVFI